MKSFVLLAIFGMILAAYGEEEIPEADPELLDEVFEGDLGDIMNYAEMLTNDTAKRAFLGGYGSDSGSYDAGSMSGSSERDMCERKIRRSINRIKKCEIAREKIAAELSSAAKKIAKLEKELEVCKHKKTCQQLTNDLLSVFHDGAKGALKCIEGAFKPHRSSGSSDSEY